jgi:hypothetical protein
MNWVTWFICEIFSGSIGRNFDVILKFLIDECNCAMAALKS